MEQYFWAAKYASITAVFLTACLTYHKTCEYANLAIDINLEGVHLDETLQLSKMSKDDFFITTNRSTAGASGLLAAMSCLQVLRPIGQMGQIRGCQKR